MNTVITTKRKPPVQETPAVAATPHAGLLLDRLEQRILGDGLSEKERQALQSRAVWARLDGPERTRWAEVALMAGETETALAVMHSLVRDEPADPAHWNRLLELLAVLGRSGPLGAALAEARRQLGPDYGRDLAFLGDVQNAPSRDSDIAKAAVPFEHRNRRQDAVNRFLALFAGRADCFARQWANRAEGRQGYMPVNAALSPADIEEHLGGRKTFGIYLLRPDGGIRTAVIDADLRPAFRTAGLNAETRTKIRRESVWLASRVRELSLARGGRPLVEVSGGKGFHFWYFFEPAAAAADARAALNAICESVRGDLETFGLEVFPKQDRLAGKGFGNLVKLPLGIHRLTGKRSYFPECRDRSVEAQLFFLENAATVDFARFGEAARGPSAEVVIDPRLAPFSQSHPELYRLQTRCPPLSQIMALCMDRRAVSVKEEKILYQTIGFLDRGREYIHHLTGRLDGYNPHLVDYRLSRLRGSPLGCRRIHSLVSFTGPFCRFTQPAAYATPLLHLDQWRQGPPPAERAEDLKSALTALRTAIGQVEGFLER